MIHLRKSVCLFVSCCLLALGQGVLPQQTSIDPATYESFLRAVAQLPSAILLGKQITLNGQTTNLAPPALEDSVGITVEEAVLLRSIAVDYEAKSSAIEKALSPLLMELRLAALAEQAPSELIIHRYEELNRERAQLVLDQIQQLKIAFPMERFQLIERFIESRRNFGSFFPLSPPSRQLEKR